MTARLIIGDAREAMATLPDGSVDLIVTSPPFLSLRSYLPADHPDKAREMGSEQTPGAFLDALLDVVEDCRRVLAPHGSLCIELGDTYAGSGGGGGDYLPGGLRAGQPGFGGSAEKARDGNAAHWRQKNAWKAQATSESIGWPLDKSACAIPSLFHVAMAYGLNPLTGRRTEPWRVRNFVAWCRPNPPVGADGDKFRRATSYITVATMARDRYWDGDAVRVRSKHGPRPAYSNGPKAKVVDRTVRSNHRDNQESDGTTPLLDWWELPTQPYPGAHYATWPEALVVPLVASMCPEWVCRECGQPRRRIVSEPRYEHSATYGGGSLLADSKRVAEGVNQWRGNAGASASLVRVTDTLGWTDCGHDDYRPGMVLDPFAGSGTTLQVATRMARDAIGIDLDGQNEALVRARVGMFLSDVEYLPSNDAPGELVC